MSNDDKLQRKSSFTRKADDAIAAMGDDMNGKEWRHRALRW